MDYKTLKTAQEYAEDNGRDALRVAQSLIDLIEAERKPSREMSREEIKDSQRWLNIIEGGTNMEDIWYDKVAKDVAKYTRHLEAELVRANDARKADAAWHKTAFQAKDDLLNRIRKSLGLDDGCSIVDCVDRTVEALKSKGDECGAVKLMAVDSINELCETAKRLHGESMGSLKAKHSLELLEAKAVGMFEANAMYASHGMTDGQDETTRRAEALRSKAKGETK